MRNNNSISQFFGEKDQVPNLADMKVIFSEHAEVSDSSPCKFTIEIKGRQRFIVIDFNSRKKIKIDLVNTSTTKTIHMKDINNQKNFFELKSDLLSFILHGIRKTPKLKPWLK